MKYTALEKAYDQLAFGGIGPDLIITTPKGYAYLKEKYRPEPEDDFLEYAKAMRLEQEQMDAIQGS